MRAYLFVSRHPYYTRTNAQGRFRLAHVPPGHYQVVCWLTSWKLIGTARDPESILVLRSTFASPVETVGEVEVRAGQRSDVRLRVRSDSFR